MAQCVDDLLIEREASFSTVFADNFDRADGALGANWIANMSAVGSPMISGNRLCAITQSLAIYAAPVRPIRRFAPLLLLTAPWLTQVAAAETVIRVSYDLSADSQEGFETYGTVSQNDLDNANNGQSYWRFLPHSHFPSCLFSPSLQPSSSLVATAGAAAIAPRNCSACAPRTSFSRPTRPQGWTSLVPTGTVSLVAC